MSQGFGVEVWCVDECQLGRYAKGITGLAQALYHRLITPRGTLRGGPAGEAEASAYGLDVAGAVGAHGDETSVLIMPAMIRAELAKDDRVEAVTVTPNMADLGGGRVELQFVIDVTPADELDDFTFTVAVRGDILALIKVAA